MAIAEKIRYEKLQYDINREARKLSALSSSKSFHIVIFSKNMMNDLIINKLKEIIKLQDIIKTDDLFNFMMMSKVSLLIC